MIATSEQIWLTSVLTEEDVSKALVLCFSLRRAFTTRKISVIVSSRISQKSRLALYRGFDILMDLKEEENIFNLKLEEFARIHSLIALKAFKICAYLSPCMIALQNSDEIFNIQISQFLFPKDFSNSSIFLFKPSVKIYEAVFKWLENLKRNEDSNEEVCLRTWAEMALGVTGSIDDKYLTTIKKGTILLGDMTRMSLVRLLDYPEECDTTSWENSGILGQLVSCHFRRILMEDVLPITMSLESPHQKVISNYSKEPIAIVGMSCRYPGANNLEEFWKLLVQGEDGTGNPPSFRWSQGQISRHRWNARKMNAGFLKDPIDDFDAKFFGISPSEVEFMDPQHRILLELVWEALEDACMDPQSLRGSNGSVFMGSWTNEFKEIMNHFQNEEFYRTYMGTSIGAAAARISFLLGMTGPSIATESGCSSSMVAVHLACRALICGDTNMALACGVNLILNPFNENDMPFIVSPDGRSKTFSEDADGYGRAEGVGVLVLKRLSDALKDEDHIWGLIRGTSICQEGVSKSMGTPTVECESLAMKEALRNADVEPHEISYVEAHGTGTAVGDPLEVAAIAEAYSSQFRRDPLVIGSVKTNVGHTESCSGITGIMKVILAMKHEIIPANMNFSKLNPSIDLASVPAVIALENMEWKSANGKPRLAGVSSFGITGTDAHVILEEPPETSPTYIITADGIEMRRPLHILTLSAKTEEALYILFEKYKDKLESTEDSIADIAFSTNTGRSKFPFRAAILANHNQSAIKVLNEQTIFMGEGNSKTIGKVCFLFSDEESMYPGTGKSFYANSPVFRMHMDQCDEILRKLCNTSIAQIFGSEENLKPKFIKTINFCIEYSLLKLWESWGVKPDYVLGHRMGEFAAAVVAGNLSLQDALTSITMGKIWNPQRPITISEIGGATCAFISGATGKLMKKTALDAHYWAQVQVQHTSDTVNFLDAIKLAINLGCRTFIEIGAHSALAVLTHEDNNELICLPSLKRDEDDWTTILNSVAELYVKGFEIDWTGFDMFYNRKKVRLPHYPFIRKTFWPDFTTSMETAAHPLIGSTIDNATATNLFQCELTIGKNEYLQDHKIGSRIVFPGAGFLEMCMAAGISAVEGSKVPLRKTCRPFKVENFIIQAPLALEESTTCQVQTVVDFGGPKNYGDNITIQIFHRVNTDIDFKWLRHVEATFSQILTAEDGGTTFGKEEFQNILCKPCEDEYVITQFYEKLSSVGLKFGPAFKSLRKLWRNMDGTSLIQVKVPDSIAGNIEERSSRYIVHPIILDAMIQAIMLPNVKNLIGKKLLVPIKVGEFVWISNGTNESDDRFVYVSKVSNKGLVKSGENATAFLLDSSGHVLAKMSNVVFVETTMKTLEAVLEQQISKMPQLWEETWRPQALPTKDTIDFSNEIGTKYWLIFHEQDSPISNFIFEHLQLLAKRKVIVVQRSQGFAKLVEENCSQFIVRPDSEMDFSKLFDSIFGGSEGITLEGVVYCWSLNTESSSQDSLLQPFFYLSKCILKSKEKFSGLRLIALTNGVAPLESNDLFNFHSSTIWGFVKALQVENIDMHCSCVDIGSDVNEDGMLQVFYELWGEGNETQVGFRGNVRHIPKITSLKPAITNLELPAGTDRFHLILPESKSITDLEFGALEPQILKPGEIEIRVKSTALNFKDVLTIMKPSEEFSGGKTVGHDFAGVVERAHPETSKWKLGDRVFGVNVSGKALPSHLTQDENDVLPIPDNMTFSEASTLPAVWATGYHSLIDIAKIQSNDTILIHTSSGGVGLCAIQICKNIGATIIATAGSNRKRNYLRFLGIQHVFNSRTLNYSDEILEVTNGRGVDVVLNSLTSEGFKEATLKACAPGARFVEMSKLHTWKVAEVKVLRPDIQYSIVDLSILTRLEWYRLLQKLRESIPKGIVSPIPYVRFDAVNIREALQYLQKGKHIGKIVCIMPEVKVINGNREIHISMFHDNSTYLITGGLGGIGFEVCKWMLKMGTKHILLSGRRPASHSQLETISALNIEYNSKVIAVQLDVSDFEQCKNLISVVIPSLNFPPLKGIMHAAGTLHDSLIENQAWASFSTTFRTKVTGTLNLHKVSKTIPTLEHFVLFSSIAALFGSPGQSNHSAGNQFEDTFAHYRHSVGLPATTINWCQWGEVGIATEFDAPGLKPISNLQGISALEYALKSHRTQIVVWNVASFSLYSQFFPNISSYLDDSIWKKKSTPTSDRAHVNYDEFWKDYDILENPEDKLDLMKTKVRFILQSILKLDSIDDIGDTVEFHELGADSLMHIEIRNALQMLVGDRAKVGTNILRDSSNISVLSEAVIQEIEGTGLSSEKILTTPEINQLIKEDCILPEHIIAADNQKRVLLSDISVVLLTGVTGKMGPHVLKELTQNPQIKRIFCLLRSKRNFSPEVRLRNILEERQLFTDTDMSKVSCVIGNVMSPQLGLETNVWQQLTDNVDAVFHFSALVRHTDLYSQDETGSGTRAVNVQGLKNILEFCCSGQKLKHVFNASTLLSVSGLDEEGNLSENWPDPNDFDGVTHLAYPISRFVGDMLMKEAITKRGIPGKVFRYPFISGDSETGRFVLEQNHLMLRYLFILKTGIMASTPLSIPVFPIDVAVKLSMEIFFNRDAANDIYNVINMRPDPDHEFVSVAKRLGYSIRNVSLAEFFKKVMESPQDSSLTLIKDLYENEHVFMTIFDSVPALKQ